MGSSRKRDASGGMSIAERIGVVSSPPLADEQLGVSANVASDLLPLNALRHRPVGVSCGWFVWRGELESGADFFEPLHVSHVADWCPEIVPYLELPPGFRVLLAPGYEDIWFDETLLDPE